jgi:hypothetical protein
VGDGAFVGALALQRELDLQIAALAVQLMRRAPTTAHRAAVTAALDRGTRGITTSLDVIHAPCSAGAYQAGRVGADAAPDLPVAGQHLRRLRRCW